ncbi:MAG: hypothetical protein K0Q49_635 [Haloplasmataceae bacterium]|jgi:AmiR/NasT family two-component response regulator|nr:hypothetical protein [Haloplasmataceae bacterium]
MEKVLVLSNDNIFNMNIKRLVKSYLVEVTTAEVNVNIINKTLKLYNPNVLIIHHTLKCSNISILLDYLVTNKVIPVIYINNVSNFGNIYNVMNDIYFMNMDEMKISSLLEFGIDFFIKLGVQYSFLNKKVEQLEHKLEEEKYVLNAKFKLMKDKNMSEEEAYMFILKQSMDQRVSKVSIAKEILKN